MHKFFVCASKSQDFAQSLKIFARSHDRETVTFRNSGMNELQKEYCVKIKLIALD